MHVFMTTDSVGGVWTHALELARGFCARGIQVTFAMLGPRPGEDQRAEAATIAGLRLLDTNLPLDWTAPDAGTVLRAGKRVAQLAADTGADLIHLNTPALAAAAEFRTLHAPVLAACHSCVASWWAAVRGDAPLPADFAWRHALTQQGYRAADLLVAPSASFAAETHRLYALPAPARVVPNGRTPPLVPSAAQPGLPPRFAFTAGRLWDEGKNLRGLEEAAARTSLPVLAAGPLEGPNGARIALRHIRTLGRLDAAGIAACLAATPVFVSLALYEPFGLSVLEAAQAGCALLLSDIPTFREIWGDAATYVPAADSEACATALRWLAADDAWRAGMGARARAHAARYGADAMTRGMLALYAEMLAQPALPEAAQ
jgi:glycosyltransferase involved in cell wall biosynthesis